MAKKLYEESNIQAIADSIRAKNGTTTTYKTSEMAAAIDSITTGSSSSDDEYNYWYAHMYVLKRDTGTSSYNTSVDLSDVFDGTEKIIGVYAAVRPYGVDLVGSTDTYIRRQTYSDGRVVFQKISENTWTQPTEGASHTDSGDSILIYNPSTRTFTGTYYYNSVDHTASFSGTFNVIYYEVI